MPTVQLTMKLPPYLALIAALFIAAAPAYGQVQSQAQFAKDTETQRLQAQQRQEAQRQQWQIQQLRDEQQRAIAAARTARATRDCEPLLVLPAPAAKPTTPARFAPTATDRAYMSRQIQRIQADPNLTQAQKVRLANMILNAVEP